MNEDPKNGPDYDDEYEEQMEQMVAENGLLLHAVIEVLIRKGVVEREEIEAQIDKLAGEIEDEERE